ncbi:hypothetical protein NHQ30_005545 [Ciborinia camelliae]|nr:hypothetical protein NHQ30_005545 [Ciborinia camelliae]
MANPQTTHPHTTFTTPTFIHHRRSKVHTSTILHQLSILKTTGRYDAFRLRWHPSYTDEPDVWPIPNHLFWDSDVAKWIEGACYFLLDAGNKGKDREKEKEKGEEKANEEIDAAVKELVDMIRSAQQEDGYLNIHFSVVEPGRRFTNLRDLHELYNAGHLIEAALAHHQCYGNDLMLGPIVKYVDLLNSTFGPGPAQKHGYPGHPEIELALLRLYERTGEVKHLDLARYFIDERGNPRGQDGRHYYDVEAEARGDRPNEMPRYYPEKRSYWYQQAHKPIVEQETIEGHAVRAMYLLTAVADLVRVDKTGDVQAKRTAVERLWNNMVQKKMYLTGGIGAIKQWEGFGIDYFLPSGTDEGGCYSETCASIGVMMFAERLLQLDLDGKYADIMELCFYNAVSTGMSSNGKQFTLLGYIGGYLSISKLTDDQSLVFSTKGTITETDAEIDEPYKKLTARNAATLYRFPEQARPDLAHNLEDFVRCDVEELHFVPYALRDNRGGKGHMRVGLRREKSTNEYFEIKV